MSYVRRIAQAIEIDSTNVNIKKDIIMSANVGIGTTTPNAILHLYYDGTTQNILRVDNQPNDNTPFIINQNGNIGIGTTLSRQKLDVIGNIITTTSIGIGTTIPRDTLDVVGEIIVAQNIGIGTTIPTSRLTIAQGTNTIAPLNFSSGANLTNIAAGIIEYDGTTFYITPNTNYRRATIPTISYTSGIGTIGTGTTGFALFAAANRGIRLSIGTYLARLFVRIDASGSTTNSSLRFYLRGTVGNAVGTWTWRGISSILQGGATNNYVSNAVSLTTQIQVTSASATNPRQYIAIGESILKITTDGSIFPSYAFGTTLTGATVTLFADNYMTIESLDTQSTAGFGPAGAGWG